MNRFYLSMQKGLILFFCCTTAFALHAQLQVTSGATLPYTPQNLISNIFLGEGVEVTSITYGGNANAVGYFNTGTQAIGIERGIILTTGAAETSGSTLGCNEQGSDFASTDNGISTSDPDLAAIATSVIRDLTVYTIKFIPTSDTLRFRYCFASEEYPEYACSSFNDVFGFFIQGPGYPVPTNIAKVPGTNLPVSINNIHPSNGLGCPAKNVQYYNNNLNSNKQPTYDGFTDVFIAQAIVTPCQEYTIKLVISDVGDGAYDSGVFLEAKSFGTGSLKVDVATVGADGTLTEGCADGMLTFALPTPVGQDFPIDYNVWGTATNGVDFQTIPTGLFIPAGQTQVSIPLIALSDALVETGEYIAVDVQRDPCNRDTIYIKIRDNGLLPPSLRTDTTACQSNLVPLSLNGTLPITLPPQPTFTNTQDYNIAPVNTVIKSSVTVSGVLQKKVLPGVISSVCMNLAHTFDDDLDIFLVSPGGQFIELSTDNGANGDNYTNTCFSPTATQVITVPGSQAPASATPFTGTFIPEGPWSDLYGDNPTNGNWQLQVKDDANGFTGSLLDWTITFEPDYKVEYQWLPVDSVACPTCPITTVNPAQTTVYTLTATDSYGCIVQDSVKVDVLPALPAPVITCGASSSSSLAFEWTSVPGATGYQVNVNGSGWVPASDSLSHAITGLAANSVINIEVQAIGGLAECAPFIGTATCVNCQSPTATLATTNVQCFGTMDGTVMVTPDGVNPPYTFTIDSLSSTTGSFQNLAAGSYTVTVTDPTGCEGFFPFTVTEPAAILPAVAVQQNVACFGGNNAIITTNATGGSGILAHKWSDPAGQTTATASNLIAGTYNVTVTDANGCTAVDTASVTEPTDLTASAVVTDAKCFNQPSGSVLAAAQGGVSPYTYAWSSGPPTDLNNNILAGSYTVTVTDANGCTETSTSTVGQPAALTVTATTIPAKCAGSADGSATALPLGGASPYSFKWSDNQQQTTATATGLAGQTYSVTITDVNGCTVSQSAQVTAPAALTVNVTKVNSTCNANPNGSATAVANGGTAPYNYTWSDPANQSTPVAGGLLAGAYTVTVTDANGCTMLGTTSITEPAAIVATTTAKDALCFGSASGQVNLSLQGGTAPFTYLWSSGAVTQNISQQPAGSYSVTATDAQGCTMVASATVGQASELVFNSSATPVLCKGGSEGGISLTVSGGTPAYTLSWVGPNAYTGSSLNLQNLLAGNYTATLTDAAGCTQVVNQAVTEPATTLLLALPAFSDTICFGASNGQATVLVTGGTPPYAYTWDAGGQITPTAQGLSSQYYNVTVTDQGNCTQTAQTYVLQKQELLVFGATDKPLCYNGSDGKARVNAIFYGADTADFASFNYLWSTTPTQTAQEATGLLANSTYTVTIVDAQGCSAERSLTVGNPYPVVGRVDSLSDVKCHEDTNGWAIASGSGGTAPYTYFWSPGAQTDSLAQNLAAGTYTVTVSDANGCPATATASIAAPPVLNLELLKTDVACFGGQDGAVKAVAFGGVAPYTYIWQDGQITLEAKNLVAGMFGLSLSDANGCITYDSVLIAQPATALSGTAEALNTRCYGSSDGAITIAAAGGTQPYRYALDQGAFNGSTRQIALRAGTYIPQIIDKNGCTLLLEPVEINQPAQVLVDLGPDITIILGRDTQLLATVTNAAGNVNLQWAPADSVWLSCLACADPLVTGLLFQNYFDITVTDSLGCQARDQVLVNVEKPRRVFVPTGFTPNDDLNNDRLMVHGQASAHVLDFRVFDRWGELVFEQTDFALNDETAGWDGTFRGSLSDPGVYVWLVEVQYLDGAKEVLKGNSTLIR